MTWTTKTLSCGCSFEMEDNKVRWETANIQLNCPKVWDLLHKGLTGGIFQIDENLGKSFSKQVKPNNIDEWGDLISIIRPGSLEARLDDGETVSTHYVKRKSGREEPIPPQPLLKEMLAKTYGCFVYQEDAMISATKLAGYSGPQAYDLVKAAGKKKPELMAKHKISFLDGCKANGIDKAQAEEVFGCIEASQRYSFNKCLSPLNRVITKRGSRFIDEIEVGQEILTPEGWCKVLDKIDCGEKTTHKIRFDQGNLFIVCTLDHKLLCKDGVKRTTLEIFQNNYEVEINGTSVYNCIHNNKQFCKISSISGRNKEETVDLEIDNESHTYYANNIAVSNSHAISYALDGYIYSAFLKAHFPRAFYCALADSVGRKKKFKGADHIKLTTVIEDALINGLKVLKPDIRYWNYKFNILEKDLLFGLTSIKGVSKTTIDKLEKVLPKIHNMTWNQTMWGLDKVNSTAAANLIKSGAFDWVMDKSTKYTRSKLLAELEVFAELTEKQKEEVGKNPENNNVDLCTILDVFYNSGSGRDKYCYNTTSLKKVKRLRRQLLEPISPLVDTPRKLIEWEKDILGREFSLCAIDNLRTSTEFSRPSAIIAGKVPLGSDFNLGGVLRNYVIKYTKKEEEMGRISLYDLHGVVDNITIFPRVWEGIKKDIILGVGQPIILKGRMNNWNDNWNFIANERIE